MVKQLLALPPLLPPPNMEALLERVMGDTMECMVGLPAAELAATEGLRGRGVGWFTCAESVWKLSALASLLLVAVTVSLMIDKALLDVTSSNA